MKSNSLFTHQDHVVIIKQAKYIVLHSRMQWYGVNVWASL